jgi:aspartyl-tRNA(Asn)/glutamyl-tRNA(Gln) amidotransferase subunit C
MIEKHEVASIASLAKLNYSSEELDAFTVQFGRIVDYIGAITSLDVQDVEPMTHVHDVVNVLRDDVEGTSLPTSEALHNAPKKNESFFKVPKVLG